VSIRKKVRVRGRGAPLGSATEVTMPVVSYSNPGLAELIVRTWADGPFNAGGVNVTNLGQALLERDKHGLPTKDARRTAKAAVNHMAGLDLKSAVVITESEHDEDYVMQDDDEIVFVLPNEDRVASPVNSPLPNPIPANLLETAKLLMACTPNGI
jgi:hypothetical protein